MMNFALKMVNFVFKMMKFSKGFRAEDICRAPVEVSVFVLEMVDFVLEMMEFVPEMMEFVPEMVEFVPEMVDFMLEMIYLVLKLMDLGQFSLTTPAPGFITFLGDIDLTAAGGFLRYLPRNNITHNSIP